ncbi:MAG: hypothetical protein KDD34_09890, partial [Bdellovibrionales bacterium]|nr:hypothetical protein [Bdellovibrionales bacterium]
MNGEEIFGGRWTQIRKSFCKNKGAIASLIILCAFLLIAVFAPLVAPYSPSAVSEAGQIVPPFFTKGGQSQFLLGTDDLGRDLLSRLVYGARVSLGVGFMVVVMSIVFGVLLGLTAGYWGGWVDSLIMRCVDILMSLP